MKTTLFELLAVTSFATIDGCEVDKHVAPSAPHHRYGMGWLRGDEAAEFCDQELNIEPGQEEFEIHDVEGVAFTLSCFGERPRIGPTEIMAARQAKQADALSLKDAASRQASSGYTLRPVTFDCAPGGTAIPAYLDHRRWNGWRMPYFPASSMPQVMAVCGDVSYDEARDVYVIRSDESPEDASEVPAETITTSSGEEIKVYPVGAGAWTWDVAD